MKKSLFLVAGAALLALSGCATPFNARVSRFSQLSVPAGQTFVVQSRDPRLQGGIEFGQYAQLVSANLVREGYRPATNPAQADLVVNMGYPVDTGREEGVSDLLGEIGRAHRRGRVCQCWSIQAVALSLTNKLKQRSNNVH